MAAAAAGITAATADLPSAVLPTPRRQETAKAQISLPILKGLVVGTDASETKVSNAALIAQGSRLFRPIRNRETAKGAGVSERGDPLLFISH